MSTASSRSLPKRPNENEFLADVNLSNSQTTSQKIRTLMYVCFNSPRAVQENLWGWSILRFSCLVVEVALQVSVSYPMKNFVTALTTKDEEAFRLNVYYFTLLASISAPFVGLSLWLETIVALKMRVCLTDILVGQYCRNSCYFRIKTLHREIDNPGQRIADDIKMLCQNVLNIFRAVTFQFLRVFAFSFLIFTIAPSAVPVIVGYALLITISGVYLFGERMSILKKQQIIAQANFRGAVIRVRENAESIAFYEGGDSERDWILDWYQKLVDVKVLRYTWWAWLQLLFSVSHYISWATPFGLLAPAYFSGEIKTYGEVMQCAWAFAFLLRAIKLPLMKLMSLTALKAVAERLYEVLVACQDIIAKDAENKRTIERYENENLVVENLTVKIPPPSKVTLTQNLHMTLQAQNESLLICGASGCGKSSLLRTIAGLWNAGDGVIRMPKSVMFLPQRAYIPMIPYKTNTLKTQLLFPWFNENMEIPDDETIESMLRTVNLSHILDRNPTHGIHKQSLWSTELSNGEKQRLAFARLLLARPKMVFLDEATSALDEKNEKLMYRKLNSQKCTYISIAHHVDLAELHHKVLYLNHDGSYEFITPQQYLRRVMTMRSSFAETLQAV